MAFALFILSLFLLIKAAQRAIRYSSDLAESLGLTKFSMGFLVIAFISILPETFISLMAASQGSPEFGLGTLMGSNVADLTLVFFMVILFCKKGLRINQGILAKNLYYLPVLALPVLLGWDGEFTRWEGLGMLAVGLGFYYWLVRKDCMDERSAVKVHFDWKKFALLVLCMAALLLSANLTVRYGTITANEWGLHPVFVSLLFVGLGTTLPEMFFSIQAVRNRFNGLAVGDVLGTVVSDATIVLGTMIAIHPFTFEKNLIHVTGLAMVLAAALLFTCMRTGRTLSKKEGFFLLLVYIAFVATEFFVNA